MSTLRSHRQDFKFTEGSACSYDIRAQKVTLVREDSK